jgi:exopolysaccharide production protein ExoY
MKKTSPLLFTPELAYSPVWSVRHIPLKRAFDLLFSAAALILGFPLFLAIALAVGLTSRGKILYAHTRIGRGGKPFYCYKFRTMHRDADRRLNDLLDAHPELRAEWESKRKLVNDPRITLVGGFLRRTSLDELPQFWNVLRGDLSVVGPRPVVKAELDQFYGTKAAKILSIRPGLTGIWQVSGRNDTHYFTRVLMDELYVDKQSFLFDLKLILKTVPSMLSAKGAY